MTSADTVAATTNLASHSTTWDVSDQPAGVGCPHDMPSHEASVAGMLEVCSIHARLRSVTLQLFGETAVTSDCYNRGGTYGRAHRPTGSTVSQAYANKFVLRLTDDLGYVDPVTLKNFGAPNVSLYDLFPGALSPDTPRDQIVTSVAVVTSTLHARWHLHDRSRGRPKCQKHLEELESQLLVYLLRAGEVLTTNRDNDGGSLRDIYDEWIEPRVYEARRYWDKVFESEQEHIQRAATTERDQQGWTFGRLLSLVPILGTGYGAGHQLDNTNVARAHLMDQIEDTKYYGWNRFIRKQLGWDEVCRQAQTMPRNCFA